MKKQRTSSTGKPVVIPVRSEDKKGVRDMPQRHDAVSTIDEREAETNKCFGSVQCCLMFTRDLTHEVGTDVGEHKGCCTRTRITAEQASLTCCGKYSGGTSPPTLTCRRSFGHMIENKYFQLFILLLVVLDLLSVFFEIFASIICTHECYDTFDNQCLTEVQLNHHQLRNCRNAIGGISDIVNGSIVHDYLNHGLQCPSERVLNDELLNYVVAVLHITSISILWFLMAHIISLAIAFDLMFFVNPVYVLDFAIIALSLVFEYGLPELVELDFALVFLVVWRGVRLVHGFYAAKHVDSHLHVEDISRKLATISDQVHSGRHILDQEYEDAVQGLQDKLSTLDKNHPLKAYIDEFITASFDFKARLNQVFQHIDNEVVDQSHGHGDTPSHGKRNSPTHGDH